MQYGDTVYRRACRSLAAQALGFVEVDRPGREVDHDAVGTPRELGAELFVQDVLEDAVRRPLEWIAVATATWLHVVQQVARCGSSS